VDDPEQHEEEPAEVEDPDSLAEDDPAADGDGLEGYGLEEGDPQQQAYNEAQSLQQALETVSAAGRHDGGRLCTGNVDLLLCLHCCCDAYALEANISSSRDAACIVLGRSCSAQDSSTEC
jgi:hypothetical protein